MINFHKHIDKDRSVSEYPKVLARTKYIACSEYKGDINSCGPTKFEGEVRIIEYKSNDSSVKIMIDFGGPWKYGDYIFKGYNSIVADLVKGTALEQRPDDPPPDKCTGRWILDMGGKGTQVWLEPEEARRIFSWAKPYMLRENR